MLCLWYVILVSEVEIDPFNLTPRYGNSRRIVSYKTRGGINDGLPKKIRIASVSLSSPQPVCRRGTIGVTYDLLFSMFSCLGYVIRMLVVGVHKL